MPRSGEPVAALYVYSAYAPFEDLVNRYMNLGLPIQPESIGSEVNKSLANQSSTAAHPDLLSFPAVLPVRAGDVKVLDQ